MRLFESLEPRLVPAGTVFQVNSFETWNANPQIIPSSDPADITYHLPSGHLFLSDSEINEKPEFAGANVFEIDRRGENVYGRFWPGQNSEPTGITWNAQDGYFYVTNDDERTVTRYDANLEFDLGRVKTRPLGVRDPEGISSDPAGNLYVVSGHPPSVGILDSQLNFIGGFSAADRMTDAEGIAYNPLNSHLYLVSATDMRIFEFTVAGDYVEEYPIGGLEPAPLTPQGLTFAPCTDVPHWQCVYIADGGKDSKLDGRVYEVALYPATDSVQNAPAAADLAVGTFQDDAVLILLEASDPDGDEVEYVVVEEPQHGRLFASGPHVIYLPDPGYLGGDAFRYLAIDKARRSATATVTIQVASPVQDGVIAFQDGVFPTPEYRGTRDTKIRGDFPTRSHGDSKTLELDGRPDISTLLTWDLASLPPEAVVQSASITFHVVNPSTDSFDLYPLLRPWDELTATFQESAAGVPWQLPGAQGPDDRGTTSVGTLSSSVLGNVTIELNAAGIAAVQQWVTDPARNFGFAIQNYNDPSTDDLDIASRNSETGIGPKLTIRYQLPVSSGLPTISKDELAARLDVDGNQVIAPSDVLIIINFLNEWGITEMSEGDEQNAQHTQLDVSGDGVIAPFDALLVINHLNQTQVDGWSAEGEGSSFAHSNSGPISDWDTSRVRVTEQQVAHAALAFPADSGGNAAHPWTAPQTEHSERGRNPLDSPSDWEWTPLRQPDRTLAVVEDGEDDGLFTSVIDELAAALQEREGRPGFSGAGSTET